MKRFDSNLESQENENSSQDEEIEKVDIKGSIDLTLLHTLKMEKAINFTIVLKKDNQSIETKSMSLDNSRKQ